VAQKNVNDLFKLTGRRALITGGAKGLGKVMATALAQAGADVVLVTRTKSECEAAAAEIAKETGRKTAAIIADVSKAEEVKRMADEAQKALGPIDILINNAGINIRGSVQELTEADWNAVIDINLKAPFLVTRALCGGMLERGWGRVINMGSILSIIGIAGRTPYAASKAGILNMTRVHAMEWATKGVTCNAICPGPFATDMNTSLINDPVKYKAFVDKIPMGRWGELHEIAGAAVFLASDAASFMTGSALYVDGGWTAQ
jgi:NAD(P)-dependent dehydrogenase (short-subunit alcohol dehydrogenase family)